MSVLRSSRLDLESLAERLVPSATVLDLTTQDAAGTAFSGAIVEQVDAQPTGTGYIRSFVRLQGAASGGGIQQGFNTDGRPLQFNENNSPQFTRSITLGQVPVVMVNGVAYREFLLDINQKSSSPYLSLDQVKVYVHSQSGSLTSLGGMVPVFELDGGGDVSVKLNARLNSGSGSGDMRLLIPTSLFNQAGANASNFVYLHSEMGGCAGATANGGFEEWAVRSNPSQNAPGTSSLSGRVFFDANQDGVLNNLDRGIAGVTIQLQGVDVFGETVTLTTTTNAEGFYTFAGLHAGTYSIWEVQNTANPDDPLADFADGADYVGRIGELGAGEQGQDAFLEIQLQDNEHGVDYIFTEQFTEG